jgi:ribonuclease BN (tRNA processing enzyme)
MQQPKIIFLGTGGDHIVVGKQIRASGGIIIQTGDSQFHLDPGPGALVKAAEYGVDLRDNTAVICTNNHLIHSNDLNAVIDAMALGGMDVHGVVVGTKSVINGSEKEQAVLSKFHRNCVERILILEKGRTIGINDVEITGTSAVTKDIDAIGIKILTPCFSLGYTSDTGYSNDVVEEFKNVDVLILNVPRPDDARDEFQLCTHDATRLIKETKPKLAIITHYGIKILEADVFTQARFIYKETNVQTLVAKDGMVINPISYDVNVRQKTLNLFNK